MSPFHEFKPRGYRTPAALRAGLEAHLAAEARSRGIDPQRLRRQVAFERLLVRLTGAQPSAAGDWVLKGGLALELRLGDICRSTRDMDLAVLEGEADGERVRNRLLDALGEDRERDFFAFAVSPPRSLAADLAGRPGWRFPINVRLAGTTFVRVRLETVARAEEIDGAIEQVTFPSGLAFAGFPPSVTVPAIELTQHAAEKFHALTRRYGDRPNTRVKDLVDLVLLAEHQLMDPARLRRRLRTVFTVRATHEMPAELPDPPAAWRGDYLALIEGLDIGAHTVDAAMALIRPVWKACTSNDHD
jgi:Nucleotidyl transferase AbiEii toxin, Type IV TA system